MGPFLRIYSTNKTKSQDFEKIKKNSWRYYHFTFVYHEWQSYNVWFLIYEVQQTKSFLILDHFLSFYWKIKILKKEKPGDIISLQVCTTNDNHMMYGSLDIRCNRQNFLWTIFCSFKSPLKTWKINIFIKWRKKKFLEILSFVPQMHKWKSHNVWFLRYGVWQTEFFLTLDHFLPFYSPNNPKNHSFDKMEKNNLGYYCAIIENHMIYVFWDMKHYRPFCRFGPFFALLPH